MWNQFWQFQNLDNHSILSFVTLGKKSQKSKQILNESLKQPNLFSLEIWIVEKFHKFYEERKARYFSIDASLFLLLHNFALFSSDYYSWHWTFPHNSLRFRQLWLLRMKIKNLQDDSRHTTKVEIEDFF